MATTTKVIDPGGSGDYTTFAACLAGQAADAATNHQVWQVKGHATSPGACDFGAAFWLYANGTNTINILPYAGHANTTGVYDSTKARMDYLILNRVKNLTVEQGIQIAAPNGFAGTQPAVSAQSGGEFATFVLDRCLITKIGTGYFDTGFLVGKEATGTFHITRNVFYMPAAIAAAIDVGQGTGGYDQVYEISGNSIYGTTLTNGILVTGAGAKGDLTVAAYNNVVAGPATCYAISEVDTFTGGNNCASDSTNLGGSNNLASKSASTVFIDAVSGDLRVKAASPTIGAGSAAPGFTVDFATNSYSSPPSMGAFEVAVPAAPTDVAATDGVHTDKVVITYTGSDGVTGYKIYRHTSDDSGSASLLDTLGDVLTYDDTSAVAGTTYYYWIKAVNTFGDSAFSTSDTGYRQAVATPSAVVVSRSRFISDDGILSN